MLLLLLLPPSLLLSCDGAAPLVAWRKKAVHPHVALAGQVNKSRRASELQALSEAAPPYSHRNTALEPTPRGAAIEREIKSAERAVRRKQERPRG